MAQDLLLDSEPKGGPAAALEADGAELRRPAQGLRSRRRPSGRVPSAADRCALAGVAIIACMQVVLSLRLYNTAFNDEALYLWAGHVELARWLHHANTSGVTTHSFDSYFAGDPLLYPPLGSAVAGLSLLAARLFSAALMVVATAGVYGFARRLFGLATGLVAAGLFACAPSVIFLSHFATIVPLSMAFLAGSMWLAVRGRDCGGNLARYILVVLAGAAAGLAGGAAYTSLLFLPILLVLVCVILTAGRGWRAGAAGAIGFLLGAAGSFAVLVGTNPGITGGIEHTFITGGVAASVSSSSVLWKAAGLIAPQAILGVIGCVMLLRNESRGIGRALAVTLMCGGAAITAIEAGLGTNASLLQQETFSLPFLATLGGCAAVAIVRLLRGRGVLATGFAMAGVLLFAGATYSTAFRWSNEQRVIHLLRGHVGAARQVYLADYAHIFEYYFENSTRPSEWASTNYFAYRYDGHREVGTPAYATAIGHGYFSMIVLSSASPNRALEAALERDIRQSGRYHLWRTVKSSRRGSEVWRVYVDPHKARPTA